MNFKMKTLVAACALTFAGQAAALSPATTPDVTLFVSGSSALTTMIGQVATSMLEVGTIDEYWDGTTAVAAGKSHRAYSGRANAAAIALYPSLETAPGSGIGKNILLVNRTAGGSIQGVNPVALSQSIASINLATCAMPTTPKVNAATGLSVWSCTGTQNRIPDAGISDVEPAVLEAAANIGTATPITDAQLASLQVQGVLGVVMGIPVTSNAPASLQNLSKAQVAGLMGGTIVDWNQIDSTIVAGTTSIVVCRRVAGSGTQAAINASIFGNPCMSSPMFPSTFAGGVTVGTATPAPAGSVIVVENSSSGFVQSCLQYAKNGTPAGQAINVKNGSLVAAGAVDSVVLPAGNYGIGVLGLDGGTTVHYNFASINGAAATMANAASGAYDIIVEATFNQRGDMVGTDKGDLFALFALKSGDPAILGTAGAGSTPVPGVGALSENGWASPVFDAALPVLRVGNFGNTCKPLQALQ